MVKKTNYAVKAGVEVEIVDVKIIEGSKKCLERRFTFKLNKQVALALCSVVLAVLFAGIKPSTVKGELQVKHAMPRASLARR